jgi:hypothetical protein
LRITTRSRSSLRAHLWAASYDREPGGIVALQSEVARAIADEIQLGLIPQQHASLARANPSSPRLTKRISRGVTTGTGEQKTISGKLSSISSRRQSPRLITALPGMFPAGLLPVSLPISPASSLPYRIEMITRTIFCSNWQPSLWQLRPARAFSQSGCTSSVLLWMRGLCPPWQRGRSPAGSKIRESSHPLRWLV